MSRFPVKSPSVAAEGATQRLPIIVGDRRARELLWLCEEIDAKTALDWGLVNQVVPYEHLDSVVEEFCDRLVHKFHECMRYTKQQTNFWKDLAWYLTIGHARDWLSLHFACTEPYEGMTAFVEKRPPDYIRLRQQAAQGRSTEFLWGPYRKACPQCGTRGLPEHFEYCGKCGTKLEM